MVGTVFTVIVNSVSAAHDPEAGVKVSVTLVALVGAVKV